MGDQLIAMHANLRAFYRLLGERSPGGSLFERAGVLAAIVPSCPHRSIVNAVVYDDTDALIAAQEELRAAYAHAGVRAWTVWVTEGDRVAGEALARRGHRIDASPRAMTLELRRLGFAEANAPGLMRRARLDARARACATSSLQATQAGFPVYRRLGYRDVCAINMWEHR